MGNNEFNEFLINFFYKKENQYQCKDVEFLITKFEELGSFPKIKKFFEMNGCENIPSIPVLNRIVRDSFDSGEQYEQWIERFSSRYLANEKREDVVNAVSKKEHGSLREISKKTGVSLYTVVEIAKQIYGDKYEKEFPSINHLSEDKRKEIVNAISKKNHDSLTQISKKTGVSRATIAEIAKNIYNNRYKKEFPTSEISEEKRKEVIKTVLMKDHGSLNEISNATGVSYSVIKDIAKEILGDEYEKEFSISKLSEEKREEVIKAVSDKYHSSLHQISKDTDISVSKIAEIAKEVYGDRYQEEFPTTELSEEKREEVIKAISEKNHGSLHKISRDTGVSITKIAVIAREIYGVNYKMEFPQDLPAYRGKITNDLINMKVKNYFDQKREKDPNVPEFHCEESIYESSKKRTDAYFSNDTKFFQKLLSREFSQELNLNIKNLDCIKLVQFDYTDNLSEVKIFEKIEKYEQSDAFLFIVGTNWNKKWEKRVKKLSVRIEIKYPDNVRIVNADLFADLIGLKGDLRDEFDKIIHLNQVGDLEALLRIRRKNYVTMDKWLKKLDENSN